MKVPISFKYKFTNYGYFPIVAITVFGKRKDKISALIDSGASMSVFNEQTANILGIEIEKGKYRDFISAGGRVGGYIHELKIEIANKTFICPIVFSRELKSSLNLLGRDNFFEKFKITFDEKKKCVTLS